MCSPFWGQGRAYIAIDDVEKAARNEYAVYDFYPRGDRDHWSKDRTYNIFRVSRRKR